MSGEPRTVEQRLADLEATVVMIIDEVLPLLPLLREQLRGLQEEAAPWMAPFDLEPQRDGLPGEWAERSLPVALLDNETGAVVSETLVVRVRVRARGHAILIEALEDFTFRETQDCPLGVRLGVDMDGVFVPLGSSTGRVAGEPVTFTPALAVDAPLVIP